MEYPVNGKDAVLMAWDAAIAAYKPFACSKGVRVAVNSPNAPTTTADSAFWETFKPTGLSNWSVSLSGIMFLRYPSTPKYVIFDLVTEQVRLNGLNIKVVYTDQSGFPLYFTGFVYITTSDFGGEAGTLANWSTEMQGSGPLDLTGTLITGTIPGEPFSDWWNTTPGATAVSGASAVHAYSLVGKTILEVKREGLEYDIVTGTPVGRQVKFTSGTGTLDFDTSLPFYPNETVFAIFK